MVRKVVRSEETSFDRTLDRGLQEFERIAAKLEA
jgi:alanyl-tRNA synthetase